MDKQNIPYIVIGSIFIAYLFSVIIDKLFSFSLLMNIIGIPFVLFLPGYSLVLYFFGEKEWLEKIVLGIALSIVIVPILGLILNFSPFGINFISTAISTGAFSAIFSVLAFIKQAKSEE